jgi:hypothetical protein
MKGIQFYEPRYVQWCLDGQGYRVTAYDADSQPIEEYAAGDHPLDSQAVAKPGSKLSARTLIKFAKQTAKEMADKHSIDHKRISRDLDSESEYRAMVK